MKRFLFVVCAVLAAVLAVRTVRIHMTKDKTAVIDEKKGTEDIINIKDEEKRLKGNYKIVLDAGHGGIDPGKVSADNILEKDINLAIVKCLAGLLKEQGIEVILTRETDDGLYDEGTSNKKAADLKKRVEIINGAEPDAAVSIHQNSYVESTSKGAQVFYYKSSNGGSEFAALMQDTLKELIDNENTRQAKENTSYYLLKKTNPTIIIVECGFLSNPSEAALLATKEYQEKVANAVCEGILRYFERKENGNSDKEN